MTDPSATAEQPHEIIHVDQGMSIGIAAAISTVSIVVVAGSTYAVVKGTLSGGMTRLLAVLALLSLVAAAYGLIELGSGSGRHDRGEEKKSPRGHGAQDRRSGRKPTPH